MKIVLSSNNHGKIKEFNFLFKETKFKIVPLKEFSKIDIPETGTSYEENAFLKAKRANEISGLPALADDSGLEVKFLKNEPGIYSARYSGKNSSDERNNKKLLKKMINTTKREAKYISVLFFYDPNNDIELYTYGELNGTIGKSEIGDKGFGYDPLFKIKNSNQTMAQISFKKRMELSHRSLSVQKMLNELSKLQNK